MSKSFNSQIVAYTALDSKPHCNRCGSQNLKLGAGRKAGEQSEHCKDCGAFLRYSPIERLKRLRKRQNFTDCVNLLESCGIVSQEAQIFVLSKIGTGGEA